MNEQEKLRAIQSEILDYIVRICNENELKYCLVYGTALGAYRHEGFIPWDDDIDIALPEYDYCRLKSIISEDDSQFVFQDMYTEKKYYMLFGKVRKKNTLFIESITEEPLTENGIYVDVFPLFSVEKKRRMVIIVNYLKHIVKFTSHKRLYKNKYSPLKFIISTLISVPAVLLGPNRVLRILNYYIKKNINNGAQYLAEFDETGEIQIIDSSIYFPTKSLMFEGKYYNCPGKIRDYLLIAYGNDYMQLPPENERRTHNPTKVDFGDSE